MGPSSTDREMYGDGYNAGYSDGVVKVRAEVDDEMRALEVKFQGMRTEIFELSTDHAELMELRELKVRMVRLADAYDANADMLESKVIIPDGLLDIMSLCSRSAAKLIRARVSGDED